MSLVMVRQRCVTSVTHSDGGTTVLAPGDNLSKVSLLECSIETHNNGPDSQDVT